jgi:hypothetical protein
MYRYATLVAVLFVLAFVGCSSSDGSGPPVDESVASVSQANSTNVQIDCGSSTGAAPFAADTDFTSSGTISHANTINLSKVTNPAPMQVYQTGRDGNFTYTIPGFTAGSSATVRLHFAETYWNAAKAREFNVSINGTTVLTNFDIWATAGGMNIANIQQFTENANSAGQFVIQFTTVINNSLVSGIEVLGTSSSTNPCATNNGGCNIPNATCTNNNGTASCACNPGFTGDGHTCTPVDAGSTNPCQTNNGGCSPNATCTDNNGTASCACKTGYSGDGKTCTAINSCNTNNGGCSPNATCTSTGPGTNSCACNAGFTGDGHTCTPVSTSGAVQIDCGSTTAVAPFAADEDFSGGNTINHANTIDTSKVTNPAPAQVYQTARVGNFTYTVGGFPAGAVATIRLHFAETYFSTVGSRVFNVGINGTAVLSNFDILNHPNTSKNTALIETFTEVANSSGAFVIATSTVTNSPLVSGIEVLPNSCATGNAGCSPDATCTEANGFATCSCNTNLGWLNNGSGGLTCTDQCTVNDGNCPATMPVCEHTSTGIVCHP